jgi:ABC-type transport system involved in cytochrome c biogenesis permease subunit
MRASLLIVIFLGALFIGALLYLGAGKTVKVRPKKYESFGPLVIIFMPLFSWMAYTQIDKSKVSLFNTYPILNYTALVLFVGAYFWEREKTRGKN